MDVEIPFKRMPWQEAMDRFGSDKPDTRFGMELCDVSDVVKDCGFGVFTGALENGGSVRGINVEGQAKMPRKKIDKLVEQAKGLEMDAISASVIGGTLLSGGVGTPFGTIFGVLIKGTISSLITTQGTLSSWWVRIVLSALLCFFIVLQAIFARMKKKNA